MEWYRVYQGLPYDAKLGVVARRSGLSKAEALALYICLFDTASRTAGSVAALDPEETGIALDIEPAKIEAALATIFEKGLVDDAGCIVDWKRLQPSSTGRVQAHRKRKRLRDAGKCAISDPDSPVEARRRRARLAEQRRHARAGMAEGGA